MNRATISFLTLFAVSTLAEGQALAADCVAAVAPDGAVLNLQGEKTKFIFGMHKLASCAPPVSVASGKACFFVDGLPNCVDHIFEEKRSQSSMERKGPAAEGNASFVIALRDEAEGRPRKTQGGKKAQGAEALVGFPYGDVLVPQGDFVISTKAVVDGSVTGFAIEDKTARKKLAASIVGSAIRVPGRDIVAGHSYSWTATIAGGPRTGAFSVTTLADEAELATDLATAAKSNALVGNPVALAATRAIVLYNHQFIFDAIRAIDGATSARP